MADFLERHLRSIQNWEAAKHFPTPRDLRNVADKLGVSIEWLIGQTSEDLQHRPIKSVAPEMLNDIPVRKEETPGGRGMYSNTQSSETSEPELPTEQAVRQYIEILLSKASHDPFKIGWIMVQLKKYLPKDYFDED